MKAARRNIQLSDFPTFSDNFIEYQAEPIPIAIDNNIGEVECCLFRITSPRGASIFKDGRDRRYDNRANRSFLARAYKLPHRSYSHVVLMYNGLDETVFTLAEDLFSFYDQVGAQLAEAGMLAILLPTPYHMNRALAYRSTDDARCLEEASLQKGRPFVRMHQPSAALTHRPEMIYANHFQGSRETIELCRFFRRKRVSDAFPELREQSILDENTAEAIRPWVTDSPSISVLGYSLGGLRAITEFLFDRRLALKTGRPPLFSGCVAICSGGSLADLAPPFWINQAKWKEMINNLVVGNSDQLLKSARKSFPSEERFAQDYFQTLRDIFLGNAQSMRALEKDATTTGRAMMFLLGGADTLVPPNSIQRINPEGGVNIVQVSGLGHMFQFDLAWNTTKKLICGVIAQFLANSPDLQSLPDPEGLIRQLVLFDVGLGLFPYRARIDNEIIQSAANSLNDAPVDEELFEKVFGGTYGSVEERRLGLTPEEVRDKLREFIFRCLLHTALQVRRRLVNPALFWLEWEKLSLDGILARDTGLREMVRGLEQTDPSERLAERMVAWDLLTRTRQKQLLRFQELRFRPLRQELFEAFVEYCDSHRSESRSAESE